MAKKTNPKKAVKSSKSSTSGQNKADMKTTEIRDLIDFISKTGLNEVNIETSELKLHVKRDPDQKVFKSSSVMAAPPAAQVAVPAAIQATAPAVPAQAPKAAEPLTSGKKTLEIKSPMIGTFYRTPTPDSPPFISVGDKVSKGQTVCIIEAMKLFNEIESEVSGTVVKVMVENSSPVEYDQVLFVVEPD
jgi:acetyl-CoA carboxylase biotin carboxyl carrier protein